MVNTQDFIWQAVEVKSSFSQKHKMTLKKESRTSGKPNYYLAGNLWYVNQIYYGIIYKNMENVFYGGCLFL